MILSAMVCRTDLSSQIETNADYRPRPLVSAISILLLTAVAIFPWDPKATAH